MGNIENKNTPSRSRLPENTPEAVDRTGDDIRQKIHETLSDEVIQSAAGEYFAKELSGIQTELLRRGTEYYFNFYSTDPDLAYDKTIKKIQNILKGRTFSSVTAAKYFLIERAVLTKEILPDRRNLSEDHMTHLIMGKPGAHLHPLLTGITIETWATTTKRTVIGQIDWGNANIPEELSRQLSDIQTQLSFDNASDALDYITATAISYVQAQESLTQ